MLHPIIICKTNIQSQYGDKNNNKNPNNERNILKIEPCQEKNAIYVSPSQKYIKTEKNEFTPQETSKLMYIYIMNELRISNN